MNQQTIYNANSFCLLTVCLILIGAFYFQFGLHEDPCPLCLLQRMAMLGVILGLSMNTKFGIKTEHFGMVIIAAMVGSVFSIRQVLLHICPIPGEPTGYGSPFLGMHIYSWGVLIFAASIIGSAIFLFFMRHVNLETQRIPSGFEKFAFYLGVTLCFANVIAAFFECKLGPCCENGPCP